MCYNTIVKSWAQPCLAFSSEVIFDNCWLGGSEALKTDALYKMAAMQALGSLFGRYLGTLKNL